MWLPYFVVELSAIGEEAWFFVPLAMEPEVVGGLHLETKPLKDWSGA